MKMSSTPLATEPMAPAKIAIPMVQASHDPRWSRQASAAAVDNLGAARSGPSGAGRSPPPKSRLPSRTTASTIRPTPTTSGMPRTHHRSSANGRVCWDQPMGESQLSHGAVSELSPTALKRYAAPRTEAAIPLAGRAFSLIWEVTAPTPANTMPHPMNPRPSASAPTMEVLSKIRPAITIPARMTFAPIVTSRAAASGACRPTTPERNSSRRPASSSARVCRTTASRLISEMIAAANPPIRHAVKPPALVRSNARP